MDVPIREIIVPVELRLIEPGDRLRAFVNRLVSVNMVKSGKSRGIAGLTAAPNLANRQQPACQ
jgi:hypothetical protein